MIEIRIDASGGARLRRTLALIIVMVLGLWLAYLVRDIWLPLIIAFLIAMVLDPLVDRMEARGWSRLRGAVIIYTVFFVVTGTLGTLAVPAVINQTSEIVRSLGQYLPGENDTETKHSLKRLLKRVKATPFVENSLLRASNQITEGFHKLSSYVGAMAQGVVVNLLWIVIIPILAFYLLKDFHLIYARVLWLVPREHRSLVQRMTNEITAIFVKYLRGLMIVCALNAVATTVLLTVLRVPNALALGAISGLLYMVPYLGAILTILLTAGVALMSMSVQMVLLVLVTTFILHNVVFDYVITPRIVGHNVGLHPILSILALLIGGVLLGILGMILAVPFAATVQMILLTVFPRLARPIEVPAGEQLHALTTEAETSPGAEDEVQSAVDIHQTIVEAVDSAEQQDDSCEERSPTAATLSSPPTARTA